MTATERLVPHRKEWEHCHRCPLGNLATHHVLFEVCPKNAESVTLMLVGEAPGRAEDYFGVPFTGSSGRWLRKILRLGGHTEEVKTLYTNLVACRPCDSITAETRTVHNVEVQACLPRMIDMIRIFQPRVIMALGLKAQQVIPAIVERMQFNCVVIPAPQPAALLRQGGVDSPDFADFAEKLERALQLAKQFECEDAHDCK